MPRRPGDAPASGPPAPPTVHLAREHLPADVAARVRSGAWRRVGAGVYIAADDVAAAPGREESLERARIATLAPRLRAGFTISHASAALAWGLPLPRAPRRAHVTGGTHQTGRSRDVVRHVRPLEPADVVMIHGHPVTSLERTVIDCATTLGPHAGLMVADAALRAGASREHCQATIATMRGQRGVAVARAVLELADDGAESAGESTARFVLLRAGLPVPRTQVAVTTHLGVFWSDLGWPDWRLLAEYDGEAKYEAGGRAADAVLAEKRRQDAIEDTGHRVLRITRHDVAAPDRLIRRVLSMAPARTADALVCRPALATRSTTAW